MFIHIIAQRINVLRFYRSVFSVCTNRFPFADNARSAGLDEVITYSLMDKDIYDKIKIQEESNLRNWVNIKNPLTEAFSIMRTSLIPGIIRVMSDNVKRQIEKVGVFETGRVFFDCGEGERPEEKMKICAGAVNMGEDIWNNDAAEFYHLKGVIESLFERLNIGEPKFSKGEAPFLHPGRTATISCNNEQIGILGEIAPDIIDEFDLSSGAAVFQLDFSFIKRNIGLADVKYVSLTRYPAVKRDLSIVVDRDILVGDILSVIEKAGGDLLQDLDLFDRYQGEQIPGNAKSLAFEFVFQAPDRTLTDDEVNDRFDKIVSRLNEKFEAEIRRK